MTIPELIVQTENQASLLMMLVKDYSKELRDYPADKYSLVSLAKLEHCYNTLLTLNDLLAKPIREDSAGPEDP